MKNALKILELMNRTEIPVYAGEAKPLVRPYVDAMDTHGGDGLGESAFPDPAGSPAEATQFLIFLMCFYQRNRFLSLRLAR